MNQFCLFLLCFFVLTFIKVDSNTVLQPEFFVLGTNGKSLIKGHADKDWNTLRSGSKLLKNDKIKIKEGGYISLVHSSGKTVEIRKTGEYKVIDLSRELESGKLNMLKSVAKFFFDNITDVENLVKDKSSLESKKTPVGGISRGEGGHPAFEHLNALLPRNSSVIDSIITFNWYKQDTISYYTFYILDSFNRIIFYQIVQDTSITLNLNELNIKKDSFFSWYVQTGKYQSDKFLVKRLDSIESLAIQDTVSKLIAATLDDSECFREFMLASYYAHTGIMNRAVEHFERSIASAKDIEGYKEFYGIYLRTIGLNEKAKGLFNGRK